MDEAWIGFIGGVIAALVSAAVAVHQTRQAKRLQDENGKLQADLAKLDSDLEVERHTRIALQDRELNAEDVLTKYREPLAAAAYDLQSRCYNILELGFFDKFGAAHERFPDAQTTTLFRFAQYFGWTEILRRDVQFLSFPEAEDTQRVAELQGDIARRLAESRWDEPLMIWTDEQRAIGERMIVEEHGKLLCMGYARFCADYDTCFKVLCDRARADLHDPQAAKRLHDVQEKLCDLVRALDKKKLRYSDKDIGREAASKA